MIVCANAMLRQHHRVCVCVCVCGSRFGVGGVGCASWLGATTRALIHQAELSLGRALIGLCQWSGRWRSLSGQDRRFGSVWATKCLCPRTCVHAQTHTHTIKYCFRSKLPRPACSSRVVLVYWAEGELQPQQHSVLTQPLTTWPIGHLHSLNHMFTNIKNQGHRLLYRGNKKWREGNYECAHTCNLKCSLQVQKNKRM